MNTNLLIFCCSILVFLGLAHSVYQEGSLTHLNQHMSACDHPNMCGSHGTCKITDKGAKCNCHEGFRGRQCKQFVSKRCLIYSTMQHGSLKTCAAGQMCIPDNFYCKFYPCKNAQGWCIPIQDMPADS